MKCETLLCLITDSFPLQQSPTPIHSFFFTVLETLRSYCSKLNFKCVDLFRTVEKCNYIKLNLVLVQVLASECKFPVAIVSWDCCLRLWLFMHASPLPFRCSCQDTYHTDACSGVLEEEDVSNGSLVNVPPEHLLANLSPSSDERTLDAATGCSTQQQQLCDTSCCPDSISNDCKSEDVDLNDDSSVSSPSTAPADSP